MKVDVITDRCGLEPLATEWNEVVAASPADSIFLTWEWASAWLDAVRPDARLLVVTVREDSGRLVAVAPFYVADFDFLRLLEYRCLQVVGDYDSGAEYADIPVLPGFEGPVLPLMARALTDLRGRWDCIWVRNVANWTGASWRFERLFTQASVFSNCWRKPFSSVPLPDTYDDYLELLSMNARSVLRRQARRLAADGPVTVVRCETEDQLGGLLDRLFELHRQRWAAVGEEGSFRADRRIVEFYRRFAPVALRRGWLRLFGLVHAGAVRAVQFGYAYRGAFLQIQEGFDPAAMPGIGNVLRSHVLKACIAEHLKEYDFLGGHTEHKRRWGGRERQGLDLFVGKKSVANLLVFGPGFSPFGRYLVRRPESAAAGEPETLQ